MAALNESEIQENKKIMAALNDSKLKYDTKYDTFISLPNQPFLREFINELAAVQYSIQKFIHYNMLHQLLSILTNFVHENKCKSLMGKNFMNGLNDFESQSTKPTNSGFSEEYNYTIKKLKFVVSEMNKICPNNFKNFLKDSLSDVNTVLRNATTSLTSAFNDNYHTSYRNVLFSILVDNNKQEYPDKHPKEYNTDSERWDFYRNRNYRNDITDNDVYGYVFSGDNLQTIDYEAERELLRELNHLKKITYV